MKAEQSISIVYTNYKGRTSVRHIVPKEIVFGKNEWHPEEQWLLVAHDIDKNADRTFAVRDIRAWFQESSD
ncbi:MAG TPA: hypothetical protein PK967_19430 [Candidatus Hydrogenedentes bacterium]|nr:hypothetical protein [Candidatus Hydrogenedentota bacterium]